MAQSPMTREARHGLQMIAPPLLYVVAVLAVPLLVILGYSLFQYRADYMQVVNGFTVQNYATVFSDPMARALMLRSLSVAMAVTAVTVALAFPVAYFVSFSVRPERKALWLFLITIPFWTSYLVRVFLWKVILERNGVISSLAMQVGLTDRPIAGMLYNIDAVVITLAHAYAPFAILPIFVALERIDRSLLEASRDLGESRVMTFLRVTLPLALPGVLAAVLIVFIPTIGDYVTPTLIGGGKVPMIANTIQDLVMRQDNRSLGAAMALTAMALVAIVVALGALGLRYRLARWPVMALFAALIAWQATARLMPVLVAVAIVALAGVALHFRAARWPAIAAIAALAVWQLYG